MAILILTVTILLVDKCTFHNNVPIPTHNDAIGLTKIVKK